MIGKGKRGVDLGAIGPPSWRRSSPARRWGRWVAIASASLLAAPLLIVAFAAARGLIVEYPLSAAAPSSDVSLGAFHVHTRASDGWGSVEEIAAAAARAGLSFVVITDHNTQRQPPRHLDGVLFIFAVEVSTRDGHLVVLGAEAPPSGESGEASIAASASGYTVLAHPVQAKNPWRDWDAAGGARGFELYSADTFLRDALRAPFTRLIPAIGAWITNGLHGTLLLATPQPAPTDRLLSLASRARIAALCSHDAHGYPPYEDVFRALAMQLPERLDPDPLLAEAQVLRQLFSGDALCVFHGLGAASGFSVTGIGAERTARAGDELSVVHPELGSDSVRVAVAGAGELLPDGRTVRLTGEGAVQIELWRKAPAPLFGEAWRPWIVPSPVRVLPRL